MVGDVARDLAHIGDADGGIGSDREIEAGFRQQAEKAGLGVVAAGNFSIGVNLFEMMVGEAARLMRASLEHGRNERVVYRHAGRPCPRCGASIRSRGQGDDNRTAYWCPGCQRGEGPCGA